MTWPSLTDTYHHAPYSSIDPTRPALSAQGKVILITGAGSGVGAATAIAFAKAGAKAIALLGRRAHALGTTRDQIRTLNSSIVVSTYSVSIGDEASVVSTFSDFTKANGPIDVCVNAAAYLSNRGTVKDGDVSDFWASFEIGVKAAFVIAQQFQQNCSDTGATLVGINSSGATWPASMFIPSPSSYASHKIAAAKLYEYVAAENPQIRCYSVHPGIIETDMARKAVASRGSTQRSTEFGPWDSVDLPGCFIVWLSSPEAISIPSGKYLWANWDVDELKALAPKLQEDPFALTITLAGYPFASPKVEVKPDEERLS